MPGRRGRQKGQRKAEEGKRQAAERQDGVGVKVRLRCKGDVVRDVMRVAKEARHRNGSGSDGDI